MKDFNFNLLNTEDFNAMENLKDKEKSGESASVAEREELLSVLAILNCLEKATQTF